MSRNPVSNQEKWKKALIQAVLGLFVVIFLSLVIFMFEPPFWFTALICLGNILWFSALPIMLVALLANAPFPDKEHRAKVKEPIKMEDLMAAEDYWPVEWGELLKENEVPVTPTANSYAPAWILILLGLIIVVMVALTFVMLSLAS